MTMTQLEYKSVYAKEASADSFGEEARFACIALLLASDVVMGVGLRATIRSMLPSISAPARTLLYDRTSIFLDAAKTAHRGQNNTAPVNISRNSAIRKKVINTRQSIPSISASDSSNHLSPKEPGIYCVRGLKNRGQTCYANSLIQALASLSSFCDYLKQRQQVNTQSFASDLYQTIKFVNGHEPTPIKLPRKRNFLTTIVSSSYQSIRSLSQYGDSQKVMDNVARHHPQFRSQCNKKLAGMTEQQDAHEFFIALMDILSTDSRDVKDYHEYMIYHSDDAYSLISDDLSTFKVQHDDAKSNENGRRSLFHDPQAVVKKTDLNGTNSLENLKKHYDDIIPQDNGYERSSSHQYPQCNVNKATRMMNFFYNIARPTTKSSNVLHHNPFDGWLGSTIKCATCLHVRPIRSTPFFALTLPIVTTGIAHKCLEGALNSEFGGFSHAERVSDVQCLSCAIKKQIQELEDEHSMLKSAILSINKRKKRNIPEHHQSELNGVNDSLSENNALNLVQECLQIESKIDYLTTLDPSDHHTEKQTVINSNASDELELYQEIDNTTTQFIKSIRGNAFKASLIMRPPLVLCIHFQRRHYDSKRHKIVKVSNQIHFPELLDLSSCCAYAENSFEEECTLKDIKDRRSIGRISGKILYKVMSVIEHIGGAFGGHYQTYRRSDWSEQNKWVLVSDESVSAKTWDDVKRCQAFMLFYAAI